MKTLCAAVLLVGFTVPAFADDPAPVAVIMPQDATELQRILSEQVPPHWGQPIAQWAQGLIDRERAKQTSAPDQKPVPDSK